LRRELNAAEAAALISGSRRELNAAEAAATFS